LLGLIFVHSYRKRQNENFSTAANLISFFRCGFPHNSV
jgi:hypothetical protein